MNLIASWWHLRCLLVPSCCQGGVVGYAPGLGHRHRGGGGVAGEGGRGPVTRLWQLHPSQLHAARFLVVRAPLLRGCGLVEGARRLTLEGSRVSRQGLIRQRWLCWWSLVGSSCWLLKRRCLVGSGRLLKGRGLVRLLRGWGLVGVVHIP